jgi:hypothetical protein
VRNRCLKAFLPSSFVCLLDEGRCHFFRRPLLRQCRPLSRPRSNSRHWCRRSTLSPPLRHHRLQGTTSSSPTTRTRPCPCRFRPRGHRDRRKRARRCVCADRHVRLHARLRSFYSAAVADSLVPRGSRRRRPPSSPVPFSSACGSPAHRQPAHGASAFAEYRRSSPPCHPRATTSPSRRRAAAKAAPAVGARPRWDSRAAARLAPPPPIHYSDEVAQGFFIFTPLSRRRRL